MVMMKHAISLALSAAPCRILLDHRQPETCVQYVSDAVSALSYDQLRPLILRFDEIKSDSCPSVGKIAIIVVNKDRDGMLLDVFRSSHASIILIADANSLCSSIFRSIVLSAPINFEELQGKRPLIRRVANSSTLLAPVVKRYLLDIVVALRQHPYVAVAPAHTGSLEIERCSKVLAFLEGRDFVCTRDVDVAALLVLPHRILLEKNGKLVYYSLQEARNIVKHLINKAIRAPI
jgi:hypothetical protein